MVHRCRANSAFSCIRMTEIYDIRQENIKNAQWTRKDKNEIDYIHYFYAKKIKFLRKILKCYLGIRWIMRVINWN